MGVKVSINDGKFFEVDSLVIQAPKERGAINCTELEFTAKGMGATTFRNDEVGEIVAEHYAAWDEVVK